ncbi:TlpA family protein disulfide reductase [Pedobacter sp. BS3]|uniref:TlpA family protein disulfide reductase n=1 Tax=Pedobacter sp. BS3 TaxID=2567937 RepID=UPI0016598126|nr:TlpA disulfide reductase family protein [Pedobacter sp. BS3]
MWRKDVIPALIRHSNLHLSRIRFFLLLGKKLPEFKLTDLRGDEFSSSQLIGKSALLNYWAIYCVPCVAEMPELNKLKEKYGDKMNFVAFTENTCKDDDLIKFLEKHPFNYYILQNAENYKKTLKISAIPRNLFIDKEGYVRYIQGNFPYTAFDLEKGIKKYDDNNYFVKIIEELTAIQ